MNSLDFEWIFDICVNITELAQVLYTFMLNNITILGVEVSFFELLAGAGIVIFIIASLVKALVPLA